MHAIESSYNPFISVRLIIISMQAIKAVQFQHDNKQIDTSAIGNVQAYGNEAIRIGKEHNNNIRSRYKLITICYDEFKKLWKHTFLSPSYYFLSTTTTEQVTLDVLKRYVENQGHA